ncbi:MAG: permease [Spirochaetota bacterium]|nr:permease [Spirochaetota bacterium]
MKQKGKKSNMLIPTLIMGVIAITLLVIGYYKGDGQHINGLKVTFHLLIEILPLLIFAFIVAGMIQVLIPKELISRWLGVESGIKGILIGSLAGALTPGGPFITLPIAVGLVHSGAGVGTIVAYMTGWSLWAVIRLPMEIGILGWRLTFIRLISTLVFPPIAGWIAHTFFSGTK